MDTPSLFIEITFNFFMCYLSRTFRFPREKLVLFRGETGLGKSTIFDGIQWCLYGIIANSRPIKTNFDASIMNSIPSAANATPYVRFQYPLKSNNILIVERKAPKFLLITILDPSNSVILRKEDEEAQKIINDHFGSLLLWKSSYYISQKKISALLKANGNDKLAILNQIAFSNSLAPEFYINQIKDQIKFLKKQIISLDIEIKTDVEMYNSNYNSIVLGRTQEIISEICSHYNELPGYIEKLRSELLDCIQRISLYEAESLSNHKLSTQLNTLSGRRNSLVAMMKNLPTIDETLTEKKTNLENARRELVVLLETSGNSAKSIENELISIGLEENEVHNIRRELYESNVGKESEKFLVENRRITSEIERKSTEMSGIRNIIKEIERVLSGTAIVSMDATKSLLIAKQQELVFYQTQLDTAAIEVLEKERISIQGNPNEIQTLLKELNDLKTRIEIIERNSPVLKGAIEYFMGLGGSSLSSLRSLLTEKRTLLSQIQIFIDSCNLQCPHCNEYSSLSASSGVYNLKKILSSDLEEKKQVLKQLQKEIADLTQKEQILSGAIESVNRTILNLGGNSFGPDKTVAEIIENLKALAEARINDLQTKSARLAILQEMQKRLQNLNEQVNEMRRRNSEIQTEKISPLLVSINSLQNQIISNENEEKRKATLLVQKSDLEGSLKICEDEAIRLKNALIAHSALEENILKAVKDLDEKKLVNEKKFGEITAKKLRATNSLQEIRKVIGNTQVKLGGIESELNSLQIQLTSNSAISIKRELIRKEMQDITSEMNKDELKPKYKTEDLVSNLRELANTKQSLEMRLDMADKFVLSRARQTIILEKQRVREIIVKKLAGSEKLKKIATDTMYSILDQTIDHINFEISEILPQIFPRDVSFSLCSKKPLKTTSKSTGDKYRYEVNIQLSYKGASYSNCSSLSPGEQQRISFALRVAIANIMNIPNSFFIFDESFSSLNPEIRESCMELLKAQGRSVFFTQHGIDESNFEFIVSL